MSQENVVFSGPPVTISRTTAHQAAIELKEAQREWTRRAGRSQTSEGANSMAHWAQVAGLARHELEQVLYR